MTDASLNIGIASSSLPTLSAGELREVLTGAGLYAWDRQHQGRVARLPFPSSQADDAGEQGRQQAAVSVLFGNPSPRFSKTWGFNDTGAKRVSLDGTERGAKAPSPSTLAKVAGMLEESKARGAQNICVEQLKRLRPDDWYDRLKLDTLELGVQGYIAETSPLCRFIEERDSEFWERRAVEIQVDGEALSFRMYVSGSKHHKLILERPDVKIYAFNRMKNNACVRLRLGAQWFLTHKLEDVAPYVQQLADALHVGVEQVKVSKPDICVDVPEYVAEKTMECLRGHGTKGMWKHRAGREWTGCKNTTKHGIKCRLYNKMREVREKQHVHYKAAFQAHGIDADFDKMWRLEFSFPRERLKDGLKRRRPDGQGEEVVTIDTLEDLTWDNLYRLWAYATWSYLWVSRQTVEEQRRPDRADTAEIWERFRSVSKGFEGWKPQYCQTTSATVDNLASQMAGVGASMIARSGVSDIKGGMEKALADVFEASAQLGPARFAQMLIQEMDKLIPAYSTRFDVEYSAGWWDRIRSDVEEALSRRAKSEFLFQPKPSQVN